MSDFVVGVARCNFAKQAHACISSNTSRPRREQHGQQHRKTCLEDHKTADRGRATPPPRCKPSCPRLVAQVLRHTERRPKCKTVRAPLGRTPCCTTPRPNCKTVRPPLGRTSVASPGRKGGPNANRQAPALVAHRVAPRGRKTTRLNYYKAQKGAT
jgi:hypothetical protein